MEGKNRHQDAVRRFFLPPSDMGGWAVRILTVAVVLSLTVSVVLFERVQELTDTSTRARLSRETYQQAQTVRVCLLLKHLVTNEGEQRAAQC